MTYITGSSIPLQKALTSRQRRHVVSYKPQTHYKVPPPKATVIQRRCTQITPHGSLRYLIDIYCLKTQTGISEYPNDENAKTFIIKDDRRPNIASRLKLSYIVLRPAMVDGSPKPCHNQITNAARDGGRAAKTHCLPSQKDL